MVGKEYAAVAVVAEIPLLPSERRDVAEREVGGAVKSLSDSSIGVGRLDSSEVVVRTLLGIGSVDEVEYAQEERRVEGAVAAEEGGVGDEAAHAVDARARSAGEPTRMKISSRRSSERASSGSGSGDSFASMRRRTGHEGDAIASEPPAGGEEKRRIDDWGEDRGVFLG